MRVYMEPEIKVIELLTSDVIATSITPGENELPPNPINDWMNGN